MWCVGIEDTALGTPLRDGGRSLDEYELTGHYERWRKDLELVAGLGCNALRYGIPWYRVNPAPERWDWQWIDDTLNHAAGNLGLKVIADLVHYGTPTWLSGSFTDERYPDAVAEYSAQFAARYAGLVDEITPVNEPLVTASFCGRRAVWPPYESGDSGWARVVVGVADGLQRAVAAIRSANPAARIAHVEAASLSRTDDPSLQDHVEALSLRKFLPTDLLVGDVRAEHPMHGWLVEHGITVNTLDRLQRCGVRPDTIGVNYYPTLSGRQLVRHEGGVVELASPTGAAGLATVLTEYHRRYGLPVWLSETALDGTPDEHIAWLRDSVRAVEELCTDGVPVVGHTWWPLFDFVDWAWASGGRSVEEFYLRSADGTIRAVEPPSTSDDVRDYLRRMGLYRLDGTAAELVPAPTAAVDAYRAVVRAARTDLPQHPAAVAVVGSPAEVSDGVRLCSHATENS